jgi:hypothetical protein
MNNDRNITKSNEKYSKKNPQNKRLIDKAKAKREGKQEKIELKGIFSKNKSERTSKRSESPEIQITITNENEVENVLLPQAKQHQQQKRPIKSNLKPTTAPKDQVYMSISSLDSETSQDVKKPNAQPAPVNFSHLYSDKIKRPLDKNTRKRKENSSETNIYEVLAESYSSLPNRKPKFDTTSKKSKQSKDETLTNVSSRSQLSVSTSSRQYAATNRKYDTLWVDNSTELKHPKSKKEKTKVTNKQFIQEWTRQQTTFLGVQIFLLYFNLLISLTMLGLAIWINVDQRFVLIAQLANRLLYTSLNRIIGLMPLVLLFIYSFCLLFELSQLFTFFYMKRFLKSHDLAMLNRILNNQKALVINATSVEEKKDQLEPLVNKKSGKDHSRNVRLRIKIRHHVKLVLRSVRILNYMPIFVYIFILFAAQMFISLYIHFNFRHILSYQLPQTLIKLIREYEQQQLELLTKSDPMIVRYKNVKTNSLDEHFIDKMHSEFDCCNYQNPYQFGELAPASCRVQRGCLNPIQDFVWHYLYILVLALWLVSSLKFCIQILLGLNFKWIFVNRLIHKLYDMNIKRHVINENGNDDDDDEEENDEIPQVKKEYTDYQREEEEEDEREKEAKRRRHEEIRRNKELALELEEEAERLQAERKEKELQKQRELNLKQERYERMLIEQNRLDELKYQQFIRHLELQNFMNSNDQIV